jgi:hypothetical protein
MSVLAPRAITSFPTIPTLTCLRQSPALASGIQKSGLTGSPYPLGPRVYQGCPVGKESNNLASLPWAWGGGRKVSLRWELWEQYPGVGEHGLAGEKGPCGADPKRGGACANLSDMRMREVQGFFLPYSCSCTYGATRPLPSPCSPALSHSGRQRPFRLYLWYWSQNTGLEPEQATPQLPGRGKGEASLPCLALLLSCWGKLCQFYTSGLAAALSTGPGTGAPPTGAYQGLFLAGHQGMRGETGYGLISNDPPVSKTGTHKPRWDELS